MNPFQNNLAWKAKGNNKKQIVLLTIENIIMSLVTKKLSCLMSWSILPKVAKMVILRFNSQFFLYIKQQNPKQMLETPQYNIIKWYHNDDQSLEQVLWGHLDYFQRKFTNVYFVWLSIIFSICTEHQNVKETLKTKSYYYQK